MFTKYFLFIILSLGIIIGPLNIVKAEDLTYDQMQAKISDLNLNSITSGSLNSEQKEQLFNLQTTLKQKLEELKNTEAIEKNGILYYNISHVVQEISGITAAASVSYGGLMTMGTLLSNTMVFTFVSTYLKTKSQNNLILRLLLKSANSIGSIKNYLDSLGGRIPPSITNKIPFKINAKSIAIGSLLVWMASTFVKEKNLESTLWTADQKEMLILQLEKMIQQLQDLSVGNSLLEEDPSSLFSEEN